MPTTTDDQANKKKNRAGRAKIEEMPTPDPSEAENARDPEPPEDLEPAPEAPKPKRGRPLKGEIRSPATSFFERYNGTPNFRETSQYWVYRLEPITDLVATGRDKYVGIFEEPLDEDKLMKHAACGSGVYMVMFKTRNEAGQMVLNAKLDRVDIENPEFPPCIPPGAWLTDRRNARWAWAKKFYDRQVEDEARKNAPPAQTLSVQDTIALVEQAIDRKMTGPKDESILSAFNAGISAVSAVKSDGGTLVQILQSELTQSRQQTMDMQNRFLNLLTERAKPNPAEEAPKGPLDQITQVAAVIKAVDEVRPPKGYRPADPEHPGWKILDSFVTGIAPGLNALIGVLAQKVATAGTPAPKPPAKQQPPLAAPYPMPSAPAIQPIQPAQPEEQKTVEPPEVLKSHFNVALEWCLQGRDPEEFADWLNAGYPTALTELRKIGGTVAPWSPEGVTPPMEAIMDIAKHTPLLWRMIGSIPGGEEKLRTFISGVLAWTPPPEDGGNDDDDQNFQEIRNT